MDNKQELFPIVNENGEVIGSATRGECHSGSRLLHPVVHLHVFNSKGEIYLQRRPEWKDIQPGKWYTAVGGHVDYGETPEVALQREGILPMATHMGLNPQHTIAFGDGGNDSSMIRAAGIGVAMGNALESLKAEADHTTTSVDDDGVLNALRHFNLI